MKIHYCKMIILISMVFLGIAGNSLAQRSTATIRHVMGNVLISGKAPARAGVVLLAGEAIQTQSAASITLEFSDGGILELGADTALELTELARGTSGGTRVTSLSMLQGRIRVDRSLAPQKAQGDSYKVETPNVLVESTFGQAEFEVSYDRAVFSTTVIAHIADLFLTDLHTYQTRILPAGHTQIISGNQMRAQKQSSSTSPLLAPGQTANIQRSVQPQETPENPLLAASAEYEGEYSFTPVIEGQRTLDHYYNQIGIPNVYRTSKCSGEGESRHCWPVILNQKGDVLVSGSEKEVLLVEAKARYKDHAYGLVYRKQQYVIMNERGDSENFKSGYRQEIEGSRSLFTGFRKDQEILDSIVDKDGRVIVLTSENIVSVSNDGTITLILASTQRLTHGKLQNNDDGAVAAIAVGVTDQILISNLQQWIVTNLTLSKHGNRQNILGVYPDSQQDVYGVVYKYVSPYNKGLYLLKADFRNAASRSKILFNSEKRNVGFEPTIHTEGEMIIVNTKDSSNHTPVYFRLSKADADASEYQDSYARHLIDMREENEPLLSFLVGTGTSYLLWKAGSEVEIDDTTYAEASYDISDSLLFSAQAEARLRNIHLALSYLQNQAQKYTGEKAEEWGGSLTKHASRFLLGAISFDGLISKSSTLRLVAEYSEINGVATVEQEDKTGEELLEFETKYQRFGVLYIRERGWYLGLDYTHYTMPGVLGFSDDSKRIVYTNFDPDFGMNKVSLLAGYNKLANVKRYETNYNGLYLDGNVGAGIGWYDVSDAIEDEAQRLTGTSEILQPGQMTLEAMLEIGYLFQRRSKSLRGLGYVINVGYRGKGVYWGTGQFGDDDESIDADQLALEFSRGDLLHGPFVQVSIIF